MRPKYTAYMPSTNQHKCQSAISDIGNERKKTISSLSMRVNQSQISDYTNDYLVCDIVIIPHVESNH